MLISRARFVCTSLTGQMKGSARQKFSLIPLFKQDFLVLAELLDYWRFGPVQSLENRMCKAVSLNWLLQLYFKNGSTYVIFHNGNPMHG